MARYRNQEYCSECGGAKEKYYSGCSYNDATENVGLDVKGTSKHKREVNYDEIFKSLTKGLIIVSVCQILLILLFFSIKYLIVRYGDEDYCIDRYLEDNHSVNYLYGEEYSLSNSIDVIKYIRNNDSWNSLDCEKRCEVIQALTMCEAKKLGIPYKIAVSFSDEMPMEVYGSYTHSTKKISYNKKLLMQEEAENIILAVLHEIFHAYQHSLIDAVRKLTPEQRGLKCFEGVEKWAQNAFYYVDGDTEEELETYYMQSLEMDARKYANDNILVYYSEIDKLLCEKELK